MSNAASEIALNTRRNTKRNQMLGLGLGILISVGILGVFLWKIEWSAFLTELAQVNYIFIPLFCLVFVLTYWIRAYRWQYLLPRASEVDIRTLFDSFALGSLAMFVLPFRAGELVRAFTLQRWQGVPFAVGFASIITERAFDVISLLILFGICLSQMESAPSEVVTAAWVLGGVSAVILVVMLLCYFFGEQMLGIFRWMLQLVFRHSLVGLQQRLVHFAAGTIEGFRAIKSTKELVIVLGSSLILWLVFGLLFQIGVWCFGQYPSFGVGVTVSVIVALAIAIPSAPGFLGVYQLGCALALTGIFGYSTEFALAYAVLTHSLQFVLVFLIGFWILHKRGISLKELRNKKSPSNT